MLKGAGVIYVSISGWLDGGSCVEEVDNKEFRAGGEGGLKAKEEQHTPWP